MRGGRLNELRPGIRMKGEGQLAAQIGQLFKISARKAGLDKMRPDLTTENFRRLLPGQQEFDF
jgi:hypothetical protein